MLALCLMLSAAHYAHNYAGIIGGSLTAIVVHNRDRHVFILLFLLLFIIDEPTAKLASFLTLSSTDTCRNCCWSPGHGRVNYSKILTSI